MHQILLKRIQCCFFISEFEVERPIVDRCLAIGMQLLFQCNAILSQCNAGGLMLRDYEHIRRFTGMIHLDVGHAGRSNNSTIFRRLKLFFRRSD
jgi:hypothetical protein